MSSRTLASGCAGKLLADFPDDPDTIARAGQIFALVAISEALDGIMAPDPDPEPVPPDETKEGWQWP